MTDRSSAHFWHYEEGGEGRPVEIEALHFQRTGAGIYEGAPSREAHLNMIRKRGEDLWGKDRPTLLLEPEGDRFPAWTVYAEMNSTAIGDGDGSHLFVIFFVPKDAFLGNTPRALVFGILRGLTWEEHAKDWWY